MYGLRRFGIKLGLDVIGNVLEGLGNPQNRYRTVHVAGTNGKGSIAASLASILQEAGLRVGRYTSPHLVRFNERICIDGQPITDEEVIEAYAAIGEAHSADRDPTFFEFSTAMALLMFSRRQVDWAVIETGMGGRLDATNIIHPAAAVISNISLEHRMYLGNTLSAIAAEKAGIIKAHTPVVTGARQKSVIQTIARIALENASPFYRLGDHFRVRRNRNPEGSFNYYGIHHTWSGLKTPLQGRFQVDNAALALAACEILLGKGVALSSEAITRGLANTRWPGRLEVVAHQPVILLDGAHNLVAARQLGCYLSTHFAERHVTLVVGILDDKPYAAMLQSIFPACRRIIFTRAKIDRALSPQQLAEVPRSGHLEAVVQPDVATALKHALATAPADGVVCVAGSLYVVGEAKEALMELDLNQTRSS